MSSDAATLAPKWPARLADRLALAIAGLCLAGGAGALILAVAPASAGIFLVGALLGVTLYHASFGFTGGWRAFVTEGRGVSLRAQCLMLALATVIFVPLLTLAASGGLAMGGFVVPVSTMLVAGALLFGFGMQLGGGCGSGTLFTVGGGSARMAVTLVFFIIGSMIGVAHLPAWSGLPSAGAVSLIAVAGPVGAIALQLAALALLYGLVSRAERRRRGAVAPLWTGETPGWRRLVRGPWPLLWGAVLLAILNALHLVTAGHPWGITSAFALWGAKIASAAGLAVETWPGWTSDGARAQLAAPLYTHTVSLSDFGLVLGAMLAAALAGKFAPKTDLSAGSLAAAVVGGLLMGYGARLSSGCNIGALFGGIASASLHGWVWFAAAFAGSLAGIRARRWFGLAG